MLTHNLTPNLQKPSKFEQLLISIHERNRASRAAHVVTECLCPLCFSPVEVWTQPALHPGCTDTLNYQCLGDGCPGASSHPLDVWLDVVLPVNAGGKASAA